MRLIYTKPKLRDLSQGSRIAYVRQFRMMSQNDISDAFNEAQRNMKEYASSDDSLLNIAQKRAKVVIEENIKQFSGLSENKYTIVWEYE